MANLAIGLEDEFMKEGFFSEYLPPSFNLSNDNIDVFDDTIAINQRNDYIEPYSFNMSRFSEDGKRRTIFIPELASYITATKFIKSHNILQELISISMSSRNSFSHVLQPSGELTHHESAYSLDITSAAIDEDAAKSTYIPNVVKKIILSKGARGILSLDISNFYNSIYTHLIPAIKLGYAAAEEQFKASKANNQDPIISNDYRKYNLLDEYIRCMNVGRTNGLLPGIMSSQFIAEALLSIIDLELVDRGINLFDMWTIMKYLYMMKRT